MHLKELVYWNATISGCKYSSKAPHLLKIKRNSNVNHWEVEEIILCLDLLKSNTLTFMIECRTEFQNVFLEMYAIRRKWKIRLDFYSWPKHKYILQTTVFLNLNLFTVVYYNYSETLRSEVFPLSMSTSFLQSTNGTIY